MERTRKNKVLPRKLGNFKRAVTSNNTDNLPEVCVDLFATLQNNSQTEALFEYVYPFIRYYMHKFQLASTFNEEHAFFFSFHRGKLVYAPNTPAFARLVEKVNSTFQDIRTIQNLSDTWLGVSPQITTFLNRLEDSITNATETFENCTEIVSVLETALERIKR